jgi:RNA polymerase sigma-70 factor (ECF subfamily)
MNSADAKKNEFLYAYDKYAEPIYRHCFFRVYSRARAEELMQDTFMKTWEYIARGGELRNTKAFLYRVANNLVIDESRKRKEASLDEILEEAGDVFPATTVKLEDKPMFKEVAQKIYNFEDPDRQILVMRFVDDLDPKDIAEIIGMSANNVSVRLNRAIKVLREELDQ